MDHVERCHRMALEGRALSRRDVEDLFDIEDADVPALARAANHVTRSRHGGRVDIEQLNNIRMNACSEDCSFCSQSALFDTGIDTYELPPAGQVLERARAAQEQGAPSYCLVAAWRGPSERNFRKVCDIIRLIRDNLHIDIECSLGFLTPVQARTLKRLGVKRYNHNLETAPSKFGQICTTHTFEDRLNTLHTAREAGLELCTGGIIGLGESRRQRAELAMEIARVCPEEVTINMLVPVPGTPLELQTPLEPLEIARMFAIMRLLLPHAIIKISGGRETATNDSGESLLRGGANGIITNGYLTLPGNDPACDSEMVGRVEA